MLLLLVLWHSWERQETDFGPPKIARRVYAAPAPNAMETKVPIAGNSRAALGFSRDATQVRTVADETVTQAASFSRR